MKYYDYTLRIDSFNFGLEKKDIGKVQELVQKRSKHPDVIDKLEKAKEDHDKSAVILTLYLRTAYEIGFSKGLKEINPKKQKELEKIMINTTVKRKTKNKYAYIATEKDEQKIVDLTNKRVESKRMMKHRLDYCKENNIKNVQEMFFLSTLMHTAYEFGFIKATNDIKSMIDHFLKDTKEDHKEIIKGLLE